MAFLIKLGSMTIVTPTASEAVDTFDKFVADSEFAEPVIRTIDGGKIERAPARHGLEHPGALTLCSCIVVCDRS